MREAITGLTTRGRAVLVAGVVLVAGAWLLGQRDLLRVGVLAVALPLLAAATVARTRYRLTCSRGVSRARIASGESTTSLVRLQNSSRVPSGLLLVEDTVPAELGTSTRALISRLRPGDHTEVHHDLVGGARGRFVVGPVALHLRDPFGLCELQRAFTATDAVIVTPRVIDLPTGPLTGLWSGRGDSEARSIAHSGDDDVIPRSYRTGDELRRVHWRATARAGELMVRREEQPWRTTATVLLDRRPGSHRGAGADSSLELSISIAASAALHLLRHGLQVRVIDTSGATLVATDPEDDPEGTLLDSLAMVAPSASGPLVDAAPLRRALADGAVLAVVGAIGPSDAHVLAGLRSAGAMSACLVVDTRPWDLDDRADTASGTQALLLGQGWRAATLSPDLTISDPARRQADTDARLLAAWESLSGAHLAGVSR